MKSMSIHRRSRGLATSVLALAASLAAASSALAQNETSDAIVLEKLDVEADWLGSPTPEQVRAYSGARTIVDEDDLHGRGALNIEDALRPVPGIHVLDETGTGILPNISVRGLNPLRSERAQILLDGYPIAIGPYSNIGLSLFPITLASIQTIDVVRGGAAVHYGPNNVGGVLNFISRPIPTEFSQTLRERLTIAEDSGNVLSDTYYRAGGFVSDSLGLQLQVNAIRGDGFREHSDTQVNNIILDGIHFPNDRNELRAQLQYYDVEAELPGALSPAAYEADRTQSQRPHDRFDADMLRGTLTWVYTPTASTEFEWRNFAHDADRTFFFGQAETAPGSFSFDPSLSATHVADSPRLFKVYGTEPRLSHRIGRHTITAGARYVMEDVQFDVNREELATGARTAVRAWSFDTDAFALYVSDTMRFLDDRLAITPGLRYEDVKMDFRDARSGASDTNDAEEFLPGLTVGYQASEQLFLFTNAQRSLVPVQTAQVTREGDVANETAWNYEIGARFTPRSDVSTQATLFRIDYEDQIQFNRASLRFENLGETRLQGVELQAAWQVRENAEVSVAYTYLDTEQLTGANEGNELPNAPRHQVSIGGDYSYGPWEFGATGVYVSESFSDAANTEDETVNGSAGKLPSYVLVNARVGRNFKLGGDLGATVGLAVNNLLDEDYYFRGVDVSPVGRVPAPGRSFILEGQVDF
jgi:Fe(3+) dicitrate transport protein